MADQSPMLPDHVLEDILARLPAKSVLPVPLPLSRLGGHVRFPRKTSSIATAISPTVTAALGFSSCRSRPHTRNFQRTDRDNLVPRLVTQHCRGLVILESAGVGMHFVFNPSTGQMASLPEGRATGRGGARGILWYGSEYPLFCQNLEISS
ncbi:hypothetical protein QYE76_035376 [Lolium multiflorum]|uniref:F-box domain-containing protein n=1 Tax=Lolium multiflorum TaxID=4521 RepID=A0AAD8VP53_LOLMU|nr:hypothetical protein QYE76_035376 [Lolium multiflorum]